MNATLEGSMQRHPSVQDSIADTLTHADRCDDACSAAAVYELTHPTWNALAFCVHHLKKHFVHMDEKGWKVTGCNLALASELFGAGSRSQGDDHA